MDAILYDKIGKEAQKLGKYLLGIYPQETITDKNMASFGDGSNDLPILQTVVNIEPVQSGSGDPAPDNVRPITGWTGANITNACGKNLFNPNSPEHWVVNAQNKKIYNANNLSVVIPCVASQYFTISASKSGGNSESIYIAFADKDRNILIRQGSTSLTVITKKAPENAAYCYAGVSNTSNYSNIQLEHGSSATTYEAFVGNIYTITFPNEAGTVYGGTLTINEDGTGTIMVDRANIASYAGETLPGTWISDRDVYAEGTSPTTGAQVVYKLASSVPYTLTASQVKTILGENNVWADTGDIKKLTYRADLGLFMTKLTIPEEDDFTANVNIPSGKFFMVGSNIYIATQAIAQGATITPGTNCTAISLAEALNSLNQ